MCTCDAGREKRTRGRRPSVGRLFVLTLCLALVACWTLGAGDAAAESIWDRRSERHGFLYQDQLAADVGDILTVTISDNSSFTRESEREMEKSSSHSADLSASTGGESLFSPFSLSEDSSRDFEGESEYERSRVFKDDVSVTVVDKLPNGNLVIGGKKKRDVADEQVVTYLTGVVRPEDLDEENKVPLDKVAKARLFYETEGTANGFLELGWFNRIINILWPF